MDSSAFNQIQSILNNAREQDKTLDNNFEQFIKDKEDIISRLNLPESTEALVVELLRQSYYVGARYGVDNTTDALNRVSEHLENIK